ncbi:MAG: Ig-like domain-containing protein, partial [Euryarchaeota archaeon]|nr:Ig-like domain-containing protein [Euryarchaeota archaeon]
KQNHLLTLAPFGWDSLKREFLWPITYFKGYDDIVVGTTNVEIKSPVEIHLFDSDGMHFGPNIDEIPNVVYYEKNDSKYLSFPINIDRFTLLLKGLDSGTYTMIITRPLLLTRSDGTSVVTILQYEITDVTTHDEDLDYFDFNFEIINDQIKEKVQQGLDVDIAIAEVLETLDMDEDGIPDIQDKELTFTKSKPTLIVPSMSKQTGDDIVFNANLHHLNEKLGGKNISFYLDNIKIGSNVTDGEGNAQINYLIPSNLATEKHNIIAAFEGDDNFGNVNGTGILNTINIAPKITIIAPEDLFVNGQVLVDADIYDANLKNISLTIDDQEVANSLPYIWDTTNFEDGIHFLQIIGVDSLGEQGLDIKLTIVNNNGYNITFLPPITTPDQFNLTIGSVLPIKFTARDNYTDEFIDDDMVNVTILNSTGNIITNFNITNGIQINSDKEQYKVDFNTMDYPESTLGENCVISVTFGCVDNLRGIAIAYFTFEEDFTPPSTITHLHPTAATTYINWTWTNPPDPNFHHTEIYLNNVFQTITSSRHHNATDLAPETSYTISTRTVDTAGNINQTWMNDTATTLPAPDTTIQITISLNSGWNLISAPLNLTTWKLGEEAAVGDPLNITPENSLTSIYKYNTTSGSFEKCTHYAGWGWDPATGSESFTELEPGRGYWAMAENDCDLTFTGTAPSDLNIPLDADWNCIGWYSTSAALLGEEAVVGDPLSVTPENSLSSIYRYNTTSESFEKCTHYAGWGWEHATGSESFIELEPGRGYWVMAENDCVWEHET